MNKQQRSTPGFREKRRRDFGLIDRALAPAAGAFVGRLGIPAGARVLDVGCGTGGCSIAAARAGGDVTGVDPREPYLSRGRAWAKNAGLLIRFQRVDRPRLPFSDDSQSVALSFQWIQLAPDPPAVIGEMQRVVRDDGIIALTAWESDGLFADMLRSAHGYSGDERLTGALRWSDPGHVAHAFGAEGERLEIAHRRVEMAFEDDPGSVAECYLDHYPLLSEAAANLGGDERRHLLDELSQRLREASTPGSPGTALADTCVEFVLRRRPGRVAFSPTSPAPRH